MVAVSIPCRELVPVDMFTLLDRKIFLRLPRNKALSLTIWTLAHLSKAVRAECARNEDGSNFSSKLFVMSLAQSSSTSIANCNSLLEK